MNKERFLITVFSLNGYHGSMMHVCELSKELINLGYNVSIATCRINKEIKKSIESNIGAKVYFFDDLPIDNTYKYVLAYHEPILTYLLAKGIQFDHLGIGSLSSFLDIETPSLLSLQSFPVFVHSKELAGKLKEHLKISNIKIIPNFVPQKFFDNKNKNTILKKIAIVSNHIPEELLEAKTLLEQESYQVTIFGKGYTYKEITPEVIEEYDIIISIGKTVQYALAMGKPIYNYDIWGGCGYITLDNIDITEYYNFSGRDNTNKKTAAEIKEEIISKHSLCLENTEKLKEIAKNRYNIEKLTKEILQIFNTTDNQILNTPEWFIYKARCKQHGDELIQHRELAKNTYPQLKKLLSIYKFLNKITLKKCFKNNIKNLENILEATKNYL